MGSDAARPDSTPLPDPVIAELLACETLESLLERGALALAEASGAKAVAVFVADEDGRTAECWHPSEAASRRDAGRLRAHALDRIGTGLGHAGGAETAGKVAAIPILLSWRGRLLGMALLLPRGKRPLDLAAARGWATVMALRAGAEVEIVRRRALHERYERWFKTLDEQLRVLDRERQKFAAIVHSSDAAVFVTDLSGAIHWTNSVMADHPPEGAASWVGLRCRDACRRFSEPADAPDCGSCPVREALEANAVVHREYRDSSREGIRSLYLTALPIRGPSGRPEEAMVMLQDLSDLEVLRASESRYRLLFERSSRAIVMVDPGTRRILLANPTASGMTGRGAYDLHQMGLEDLHPKAEWERLEPIYAEAIASGALEARECLVRNAEGPPRVAVVTGTRTDFDGRSTLMLEFRDVTETRQVQEALRMAEARLRTVVAASPIVLFATDRRGVFTVSEGRGLARLGLKPGEVVGKSAFEVYQGHPTIVDNLRRALAGEECRSVVEVSGLAFESSYAPLLGADGEVLGIIGVATDVTERRRLEDQLRQAQRMEAIGRLAGGVAHDFNNLLAAILGHSELMLGRIESGHPLRRGAEEIQKAAARGAMLTRQLLAFGRREVVAPRVVDLNVVMAGMDGMLRRLIAEDIQLESVPSPGPAPVKADRVQLEQVMMNLVVNARDAMPKGGRITVQVENVTLDEVYAQSHSAVRPGPHVMLSVTDTGHGMDPETLAHVFEPFFTTKERGKGTGLGLATVYGIVEQNGGHVLAYSEPGIGSAFKVYLPRADAAALESTAAREITPARGGSETVLLVEDEDAVRATAREALESSGYEVLEACDGVQALEAHRRHAGAIHLLVSDVVMPRMGGGELAHRLTTERPELRVLFISGYPDDAVVRHGVVERGSALLQKPFALAEFVRKVREVLDAPAREAA